LTGVGSMESTASAAFAEGVCIANARMLVASDRNIIMANILLFI
jgi:hypothetical protein